MTLSFWLGCYYGAVLGLIIGISYRHWESLYEPRPMDKEEFEAMWERNG